MEFVRDVIKVLSQKQGVIDDGTTVGRTDPRSERERLGICKISNGR